MKNKKRSGERKKQRKQIRTRRNEIERWERKIRFIEKKKGKEKITKQEERRGGEKEVARGWMEGWRRGGREKTREADEQWR